jgi:hypothetical protein
VGGTEFPNGTILYNSEGFAEGYATPEGVWNESTARASPAAGGGGISVIFPRPSYQSAIPTCKSAGSLPVAVPSSMRQVPDVALTAASNNNPYLIGCTKVMTATGSDCSDTGGNLQVIPIGGTSASTPSFAGVLALAIQGTGAQRLGNINPLLYALNASAPAAFHDITEGSNAVACIAGVDPGCLAVCPNPNIGVSCYGYGATAGYDCASGLGSIDAFNLVSAWATLAPTTTTVLPSLTTTSEGSSVNLTATVDVATAKASALGGTVTFAFQSYDATGAAQYSWTLGSNPIVGGTTSTGTAAVTAVIPVGLVNPGAQYVDVVAMYGGDAQHLASVSAPVRVSFTGVDLCISQGVALETVPPGAAIAYSTQGGLAPITWEIAGDSTCDSNGNCSTIDATTGAFIAGPEPGYVIVRAVDSDFAFARAFVTVGTGGTATPPWGTQMPSSCSPPDGGPMGSGPDGGADSAPIPEADSAPGDLGPGDSGPIDAGSDGSDSGPMGSGSDASDSAPMGAGSDQSDSGPSEADGGQPSRTSVSGCGCVTAGRTGSPVGTSGAVVLGLGLGLASRRTRRDRAGKEQAKTRG